MRLIDGVRWHLRNENPEKDIPFKVQLEALRKSGMMTDEPRKGFNWWLQVGMGKTTTALNEFIDLRNRGMVDYLVVVTLGSFRASWPVEAKEFGLDLSLVVWPFLKPHWDKDRQLRESKRVEEADGLVLNWEAVIGSGGDFIEQVLKSRRVYMVVDEAHKAKDPQSKVTKRLLLLCKDCFSRWMTGTPQGESVMDLYPPLKAARVLEGSNPFSFRNRFAKMGGYMGKKIIGYNEQAQPELDALLLRGAFRAEKKDWMDIPEQNYPDPIRCELPDILKPLYHSMLTDFIVSLDEMGEDLISVDMVMNQLNKLQQISSGFIFDEYGNPRMLAPIESIPKWQVPFDILDSLGGRSKLLLFTHFRPSTDQIRQYLEKKLKYKIPSLCGGMTLQEVEENKAAFNSKGGPMVMVAQIKVASEAHTLLGHPDTPCFTSLFGENIYSRISRTQAEGRNHRGWQKNIVSYYDTISSPVEKDIISALQTKAEISDAVVNGAWRRNRGGGPEVLDRY